MCNFIQREYGCGHHRYIASKWCTNYTTTHKRCAPNLTHYECVRILCGDCKARAEPPVPWADLIKRPGKHTALAL